MEVYLLFLVDSACLKCLQTQMRLTNLLILSITGQYPQKGQKMYIYSLFPLFIVKMRTGLRFTM